MMLDSDFPFPLSFSGFSTKSITTPSSKQSSSDKRKEFENITRQTPRDTVAERAFIASKINLIRTDPKFAKRSRLVEPILNKLEKQLGDKDTEPVPGGVGYGTFYNDSFKVNFTQGTAIYWEIVCPTLPGGNVNTYLYLTATNRSVKGVEAFISYNGQNDTYFKVYDWARPDNWQTNIPFANLSNYLKTVTVRGESYQVLPLLNSTALSDSNSWYNQVWLFDNTSNRWDLVYQYGPYSATIDEQKIGWVGSWGPIVETFQDTYQSTNPMGTLNTQLISRDNNQWGSWKLLSETDSSIRDDNKGFRLKFLDPNYNWVVTN